jgi:hypothetical protein
MVNDGMSARTQPLDVRGDGATTACKTNEPVPPLHVPSTEGLWHFDMADDDLLAHNVQSVRRLEPTGSDGESKVV